MNIFILNTGRCGSTTFIKACSHISNYTAGHESLTAYTGAARLAYPDNHIEADNRLSWFTGRLHEKYADKAYYVHLYRDTRKTIDSFVRRKDFGIMKAYQEAILLGNTDTDNMEAIAEDYIQTVESNIKLFLRDKPHKMEFRLEHAETDFKRFWDSISAEGNLQAALEEWKISYNCSAGNVRT